MHAKVIISISPYNRTLLLHSVGYDGQATQEGPNGRHVSKSTLKLASFLQNDMSIDLSMGGDFQRKAMFLKILTSLPSL